VLNPQPKHAIANCSKTVSFRLLYAATCRIQRFRFCEITLVFIVIIINVKFVAIGFLFKDDSRQLRLSTTTTTIIIIIII